MPDGGVDGGTMGDGGLDGGTEISGGGCGCTVPGARSHGSIPIGLGILGLVALVWTMRRRRR
jgi:MYXO-CTERM domain-containing protein